MQLPVDVGALLNEATAIEAAQEMPLSVSVYVDATAPAGLVAHVRNAFASAHSHVRMTVTYLDDTFVPYPTDDMAIVVAGTASSVGACAAAIRLVGVPVMVVTIAPESVAARAEQNGRSIPDGDVVSPFDETDAPDTDTFDDAYADALDERMGRWIVSACREKRLAFSIAFPFMRRALARDAVQATSLQNAAIGLIPLIPGADLPIITLNQAKMVLQISAAYGHDMDKSRLKELALVIGGAYLSRTIARKLIEFVPFLGFAIRTVVAYGGTSVMGYAVIEYYEGGEDATGLANVAEKAGSEGAKLATRAMEVVKDPSSVSFERAGQIASVVREKAQDYIPKAIELAPQAIDKAKSVVSALAGAK